jgi:hypothetical protein
VSRVPTDISTQKIESGAKAEEEQDGIPVIAFGGELGALSSLESASGTGGRRAFPQLLQNIRPRSAGAPHVQKLFSISVFADPPGMLG